MLQFCLYFKLSLLFSLSFAHAQEFDISGTWNGTIEVPLKEDILGEYFFEQQGSHVGGFIKMTSLNKQDSTKYHFSGYIKNGVIHFKGTEFEYRAAGSCLSLTDLQYSFENGQERLKGRWYGDFSFSTCPPGVSGKIDLTRVPEQSQQSKLQATRVVKVDADDLEGQLLLEELNKRRYYALLIGVDTYPDDAIIDLDHPVKDARSLGRVLETNYTFAAENIKLLDNPSRTEIIEAFDALANLLTDQDHLLVFYAGHGVWDERLKQGFWLPADAALNSKAQWISNSTVRDYLGGIKAKHTILIADACFGGSIFKERAVTFENSKALFEMYRLNSRKAMTSGALKTVPDKSVFITYLLKNLVNNEQPLLSAEDLFSTFKMAVINNSPNGQVPQYGAIGNVGDEGGDFIFLKRVVEK